MHYISISPSAGLKHNHHGASLYENVWFTVEELARQSQSQDPLLTYPHGK